MMFPEWSIILILALVVYAALAVAALLSVGKAQMPTTTKAIWVLVIVIAPFIGSLCWFLIGARSSGSAGHAGSQT